MHVRKVAAPDTRGEAHAAAKAARLAYYAARPCRAARARGRYWRRVLPAMPAPAGQHYHATKGFRGGVL